MKNTQKSKIRVNKLERIILDSLDSFGTNDPDLTTAEITAVFLRILSSLNHDEIRKDNK